jgi:hypothetical protein
VSAGTRDAFVQIEESLDFFESIRGSMKILDLLDVADLADQILEVSLDSLGTTRRPVALRSKLTTPDEDDIRESVELGRGGLIWKFDEGRGSAASFNTNKTPRNEKKRKKHTSF